MNKYEDHDKMILEMTEISWTVKALHTFSGTWVDLLAFMIDVYVPTALALLAGGP